jgi:trimeric autotransporter adhesin
LGTVTQGSAVAAQVITLTSSGTGPLHITSVAVGGTNASDFSLTNNCAAPSYAVGATCTIGVSLSPLTTGLRAAFITIADDAPNSPQTISLGATVTAALTISPAAPGSTSVTVTAGQTASFNLLLTPGPGFAGSASFACAGTPSAATCAAPSVQLAAGNPVSYAVTVATTASTVIVSPPQAPQFRPFIWLPAVASLACFGIFVVFLYASRLQRWSSSAALLRVAALAVLASLSVFEAAGCAGGGASASPQVVPTPRVTGTPQGTSTITLTPSVTTSTGTPLPGISPVQLTLTVQ